MVARRYENWSKKRLANEAVRLVQEEGWTQVEAAAEVGISRQTVARHLKAKEERDEIKRLDEERKRKERTAEAFSKVGAALVDPIGIDERRRVPETFEEWDQLYFSGWRCPDCGVRHDTPEFHKEISRIVRDPETRRALINLPPYHSKTTNVSVKDTVIDICSNPNLRTIIVSKTEGWAKLVIQSIQEILTVDELYQDSPRNLIEDWGPFKPDNGRSWSATQFFVAGRVSPEKDPTVLALGVEGQIYGRRADKIKFDDIGTLENMKNPEQVMKVLEWIDKEALSRIGKKGQAIWVGTRIAPGDVYYHLGQRQGYRVLKYPCIIDDVHEVTLWPEHFPYSQALIHRGEMTPRDFQLVYQNVDVPGIGASFTEEMIDQSKDSSRVVGHYDPKWRIIAGLDPAGAGKDSGYTAITIMGVDLATGNRYIIDSIAHRQLKAPQLRDLILELTDRYPIYEWRVEGNGLQQQLVQYNEEILRPLALRGVRVQGHITDHRKWDPEFGVESMAPLMSVGMMSIPWGNQQSAQRMQPFVEELIAFPMGRTSDRVMSWWFADLGIRDYLRRGHLPMFDERATKRWPERIKRRRKVIDFNTRQVRPIKPHDQRGGHLSPGQLHSRRMTLGRPARHDQVTETPPPERRSFVNVEGSPDDPWDPA